MTSEPTYQDWASYRAAREAGAVQLGLSRESAKALMRDPNTRPLNRATLKADVLWRTIAIVFLVGGFVAVLWWPWWSILIGLALGLGLWRAADQALIDNLLRTADVDPAFYESAASRGAWAYRTAD